ncbi:UIMC1 protein, partial [Polypterus senegalus]
MPRKRRTRASKLEETTVPPKKRQRKTSHVSAGTDRETEAEDIKIEEDDTDEDLSNGGNCKTKDTDLSEEDMLNLALKISEEEANRITLQQQAEDEAVKKAIDESLCEETVNDSGKNEKSLKWRERLQYKRRLSRMTEDELVALAMRMSEQETKQMMQQPNESNSEEDTWKSLKASLCTSSSYRVQHFALPASPLLFNTEDTGEHEMTPSVRCDIMEENSSQHKGNDETEESEVCPESLISEEADPVILKESSLEVQEGLVLVNDDDYGNDKVGKSTLGNRNDNIECPICRKSFPPQHIELHAAYCDGIEEIVDVEETIPKVKSSRRSSRKPDSLNYKFNSSSVNTSISIHSDDDDDDGDNNETSRQTADKTAWSFTVSDSPIKSFVPISQATDCLIDFKQQFTSKRGKRGVDKARKRRFK